MVMKMMSIMILLKLAQWPLVALRIEIHGHKNLDPITSITLNVGNLDSHTYGASHLVPRIPYDAEYPLSEVPSAKS